MGNRRLMSSSAILILLLLASVQPFLASAECTCEAEEQQVDPKQTHLALVYKLIAVGTILLAGALGVCIPVIGQTVIPALLPDGNIFFLIKAFAGGVILSTGMVHILPDSFDDLTSPCLNKKPWGDFPLGGFIAMMAGILTLMADTYFPGFFRRKELKRELLNKADANTTQPEGDMENGVVEVHTHATHGHAHGSLPALSSDDMLLRHKIMAHVLELGIVVHSVIIGISVGVSHEPSTIKPLIAALCFHQFFEGMGLGGCFTQAKFRNLAVAWRAVVYSLTTPIGIGIGMGIAKSYSETSRTALILQGSMNATSAGILVYMAFVDLLAPVFMDNQKLVHNSKLQLGSYLSLVLGAGCMSVIALWA